MAIRFPLHVGPQAFQTGPHRHAHSRFPVHHLCQQIQVLQWRGQIGIQIPHDIVTIQGTDIQHPTPDGLRLSPVVRVVYQQETPRFQLHGPP